MAQAPAPVGERREEDAAFEHLVLDFLAYLELERGLSRNTLQSYRTDLLQFGAFLRERAVDAPHAESRDVSDFLTALAGAEGSAAATATIQRKAACLRSFYRHDRQHSAQILGRRSEYQPNFKNGKEPNQRAARLELVAKRKA